MILGLCYGSFLNVLIYRLPNNLSIISPRSFCPNCKVLIPFYRNIPIISFLTQKGKCFNCYNKISMHYPAIEALTGFLWFYFSFITIGTLNTFDSILHLSFSIIMISFLIPLAVIDYKYLYFPYSLILPLITISISFSFYELIYEENLDSIIGVLVSIIFMSTTYLITKIYLIMQKRQEESPLGIGDILLMIPLSIWIGPVGIICSIFMSSILGLIIWIILYYMKNYNFNNKMPFGPYLIITSIVIKMTGITNLISVLIFQTV